MKKVKIEIEIVNVDKWSEWEDKSKGEILADIDVTVLEMLDEYFNINDIKYKIIPKD